MRCYNLRRGLQEKAILEISLVTDLLQVSEPLQPMTVGIEDHERLAPLRSFSIR